MAVLISLSMSRCEIKSLVLSIDHIHTPRIELELVCIMQAYAGEHLYKEMNAIHI